MSAVFDDTIAAIATALGEAGLCMVRMSGPDALTIADRVFRGRHRPSRCKSHTVHYGHIIDPVSNDVIDEVLLTVMRAPRTFTCEHVAEISGHGGRRPGHRILEALLKSGARLAAPGEFTKRAFLNGRLDLVQAEAVAEIIRAHTDASMRAALRQLDGRFSRAVDALRDQAVHLLALIEVGLDFTEEDIPEFGYDHLYDLAKRLYEDMNALICESERFRVLRDGARVAIVGRPNVGKSSLLNTLLGRDRAIVDATPGTTRDTLEEAVDLHGIPVVFVDTAGIRRPGDAIEAAGIRRAQREMDLADLFVWIIDGSECLSEDDHLIYSRVQGRSFLPVVNKIDLPQRADLHNMPAIPSTRWIRISARNGDGIAHLTRSIAQAFVGEVESIESNVLINTRHRDLLARAQNRMQHVLKMVEREDGQEVIAVELREVIQHLGEMLGKDIGDEVLSRIFSTFCIGK